MNGAGYLTDHLLIAMPTLADPRFSHAVTYVCEHNDDGALGIVINRPGNLKLGDILSQMSVPAERDSVCSRIVYQGGPVSPERGFVLHTGNNEWEATLRTGSGIGITSSRDILEAIARGEGPNEYLVALGYAGWGPGQLDQEMRENAWLSTAVQPDILFHTPDQKRWEASTRLLGIDPSRLSGDAGHA